MVNIKICLIIISLMICGCSYHTSPSDPVEFSSINDINQLYGMYKNDGEPEGFLSFLLWGDEIHLDQTKGKDANFVTSALRILWDEDIGKDIKIIKLEHEDIDFIKIDGGGGYLVAKAIKNGCIFYEQKYKKGEDFKIEDGRLLIEDFHLLTRGGDDPMLGPSNAKVYFGIEKNGHGVYRSEGWAAGIVYSLFPVMASDSVEIRFRRVNETKSYQRCTNP